MYFVFGGRRLRSVPVAAARTQIYFSERLNKWFGHVLCHAVPCALTRRGRGYAGGDANEFRRGEKSPQRVRGTCCGVVVSPALTGKKWMRWLAWSGVHGTGASK